MAAGNHDDLVLLAMDELCDELGFAKTEQVSDARSAISGEGVMGGILSREDEALAQGVRTALARIASGFGFTDADPHARVVTAALDGAEMALRGELLSKNAERLPQLLPSLVFLVTLPILDQGQALALSDRMAELIAERLRTS